MLTALTQKLADILRPCPSARPRRRPHATGSTQVAIEMLEQRVMLTARLFLDFGAAFAAGGLNTTVNAFRNINGVDTGSDLTSVGMASGANLNFARFNYDFNNNGTAGEVADVTALAAAVVPLIQRALEPFNIDVVVVSAANFADVLNSMNANNGDPTGEFDAYNFIADITSTQLPGGGTGSVGNAAGLFGIAAGRDLFAQAGNNTDEATLTFADVVRGSTAGTPGTAAFNAELAQRIAYTVTHEAFHTFAFVHTTGFSGNVAGQRLMASGDVIRLGSVTRQSPFIVTRFDLQRQGGFAVAEPNNYLQFANDPDLGLRDANGNGRPDLAYITGTGAHDRITLTDNGGGIVGVRIEAFSDSAMTTLIATETYTINLATETEGVILIDSSINSDLIIIDGTINATIRLRGGIGADGIASATDSVTVNGFGRNGQYLVNASDGGTISIASGVTIFASELEQNGRIRVDNVGIFTVTTGNGIDLIDVDDLGLTRVTGTINGGVGFVPLELTNVTRLLINTLGGNDTITVDTIGGNPIPSGGIRVDGGNDDDTLVVRGPSPIRWSITGANSGNLDNLVEFTAIENLTGGNQDDEFAFQSGSSISGNVNGQGGTDELDLSQLAAQDIRLTGIGAIDGFDGTTQGGPIVGTFRDINFLAGSNLAGNDQLTGLDADATWTVDSATPLFRYSSSGRNLAFSLIEVLNGGSLVDVFNVIATNVAMSLNGRGGNDIYTITSTAGVNMDGNLDGIQGELSIDAGAGTANRLIVSDFGGAGNPNVIVTADKITNFAPAEINYAATGGNFSNGASDGILLRGSNADPDVFNIQSTLFGSTTKIEGNGGDDLFELHDAANTLNGIQGTISVDAGAGTANRLIVSDFGGAGNPNVIVTNNKITGFAPAEINYEATGNFANGATNDGILLKGSNLSWDTFRVRSTLAGSTTKIEGNAGHDVFEIHEAHSLAGILGLLSIDAGAATGNQLIVSGVNGGMNPNVIVTENKITNFAPVEINYEATGGDFTRLHTKDGILLRGSNTARDVFHVRSTRKGSTTYIEGNGGADSFTIGSDAALDNGNLDTIQGLLTLFAGASADDVYVNDFGKAGLTAYRLLPDRLVKIDNPNAERGARADLPARPNFAGIFFDGSAERLKLVGNDEVNLFVVRPSKDTEFTVDGRDPEPHDCTPGGGDFLKLDLKPYPPTDPNPVTGQRIHFTRVVNGRQEAGYWYFNPPHKKVNFEHIERFNFVDKLVVASDAGKRPNGFVQVLDAASGRFEREINVFPVAIQNGKRKTYLGGVRVASADMNCDGIPDIIVAAGPGHLPEVKVFNGIDGRQIGNTLLVGKTTDTFGVNLAVADTNFDGHMEVITSLERVSGAKLVSVHQFEHNGFRLIDRFDSGFNRSSMAGVNVAAGDLNKDGRAEIIVTSGYGVAPGVAVFDRHNRTVRRFNSFARTMNGGIFASVGDVDGTVGNELILTAGRRGNSELQLLNGQWAAAGAVRHVQPPRRIFTDQSSTVAALRSALKDIDGDLDQELYVTQGTDGRNRLVRLFDMTPNLNVFRNLQFLDQRFGGYFIG